MNAKLQNPANEPARTPVETGLLSNDQDAIRYALLRQKLLRDTERYLNNPHAEPWQPRRATRTCGMISLCMESTAA